MCAYGVAEDDGEEVLRGGISRPRDKEVIPANEIFSGDSCWGRLKNVVEVLAS